MTTNPPRLRVEAVRKAYGEGAERVEALADVSFEQPAGSFLSLVGPSGSGKSTLLRLVAGLERPDAGRIFIDDRPIERGGPTEAAYMPQRDLLFPWRRLIDNLTLGPEIQGRSRAEARRQARDLMPTFGLDGFERAWPPELSGGMRQRAALLRTVLLGRDLLLLDEPFGALDALTRLELQDWLAGMWRQAGWTVLLVTHDVEEAVYLSDRVLALSPRPGRLAADLTIDLPRPRDRSLLGEPAFGRHVRELLGVLGVAHGPEAG